MKSRALEGHLGVKLSEARHVEVVAHLAHGAILDPQWPQPLDGVLAAVAHRRALGERYGTEGHTRAHDLPLKVVKGAWPGWPAVAGQWVWAATCAQPVGLVGEDVRWWHRRFDVEHAVDMGLGIPDQALNGQVGRYRSWRMPDVVTVCAALRWECLGDPDRITDLLDDVDYVGAKRRRGEGVVVRWEVHDRGDVDIDRIVWQDGRIARPIPARAATSIGIDDPDVIEAAIRPPYWRPPQTDRDGGGFARAWREVIAPWTQQPSTHS